MKKIFTTGQVAKICQVAPRTVSKWFDTGRIKGFRIPGSQDRRIPRDELEKFLADNGMPPIEDGSNGLRSLLLVGVDRSFADLLRQSIPQQIKVTVAATGFDAGLAIADVVPDVILIDGKIGGGESVRLAQALRKGRTNRSIVIGLAASVELETPDAAAAFHEIVRKPTDIALLGERIQRMAAERRFIS